MPKLYVKSMPVASQKKIAKTLAMNAKLKILFRKILKKKISKIKNTFAKYLAEQ